jgi:hypothetical protein
MKGKKGMLLAEETLKIVIALIAISFLVYFLVSLYFNSINSEKLEQATSSIERIKSIIENTAILIEDVTDITPAGWILFSFIETKPNACAGQNCLCICPSAFWDQEGKCDDKGVCEIVEKLESFEEIKIQSPGTSLTIIKSEEKVGVAEK